MENFKLSIIVPVYKVEKYLERCLNSLVNQAYKNFEIILVDDGSPDLCPQICDIWAARYPYIKVIHQKNQGAFAARNAGLLIAEGELITFVDADDWIESDSYHMLIQQLCLSKASAVFWGFKRVKINGDIVSSNCTVSGCVNREQAMLAATQYGYFVSVWNKMFKREFCFRNNEMIRFKPYVWAEDEMWLFEVLSNIDKVLLVPIEKYYWCMRSDSVTEVNDISRGYYDVCNVKEKTCDIAFRTGEKIYQARCNDLFYKAFDMFVEAFMQKNVIAQKFAYTIISKYMRQWLRSKASFLSKLKKIITLVMIKMRIPKNFVAFLNKK